MNTGTAIKTYLAALTKANVIMADAKGYDFSKGDTFDVAPGGRKFAKIVRTSMRNNDRVDQSVVCFVDKSTGDIWKAAGWKGPALNFPRGSVFDLAATMKTFDVWHSAGTYGAAFVDAALADMGIS